MSEIYIFHSDTTWNNKPYKFMVFSSSRSFHDVHFSPTGFALIKTVSAYIKQAVPSKRKNYDSATKIWMLEKEDFLNLQRVFDKSGSYTFRAVLDVPYWVANSKADYDAAQAARRAARAKASLSGWGTLGDAPISEPEKAEDFFYSFKEQPLNISTSKLTIDQIISKLKFLGLQDMNKSEYRKAALRFHPDRNNGDGSKMSELNMLWEEYKKLCPVVQ